MDTRSSTEQRTQKRTEEEITTGLMAMVTWAGNSTKASEYLKSAKGMAISPSTLRNWTELHGERYDEMRQKYRDGLERRLENEQRELAYEAIDAQKLAVQRVKERLERDQEKDPARAAANLSAVAKSAIDKVMSLSGRPKEITAQADPETVLRGLMARHPQLFPGTTEEETDSPRELEAAMDGSGD